MTDTLIPDQDLARVQGLYDQGLYLQAYEAGQAFGPLSRWTGPRARTLAGRLAVGLGDARLGGALHWLGWRADRSNTDLAAYRSYDLLRRRGPLATLDWLERHFPGPVGGDPEGEMHLATVLATATAHLRDFETSREHLEHSIRLTPDHPWPATVRAHLLELEDRYEDALAAARDVLEMRPWFRPGVQALAHALQLLDRDEEALEFLSQAAQHLECMHVMIQLAGLQQELGLYTQAAVSLARVLELGPLLEPTARRGFQQQRVTLDCLRGDLPSALAGARSIGGPYYQELARRIEAAGEHRRVLLPVPFVRQHHMTCAPATLSALSKFWGRPAEHLELAEAICYDGTPSHSQRHWAETHGWRVREFTVSWDAARGLLNRKIPFAFGTAEVTSAHLQAIVGFDELRQTVWIRDPMIYHTAEVEAEQLLDRYRASGPRGFVMVPSDRPELIDGLDLPEASLYDQLHQLQQALATHNRTAAIQTRDRMQTTAPGHRLSISGRWAVAFYDGNLPVQLECVETLQALFPRDGRLRLAKLNCLRELARRDDRLRLLGTWCAEPGIDPVFWQEYAQELRADARQHRAAASWLGYALRARPTDPILISAWADLLWDQRQFAKASRLYRFAACLDDKREQFARSFFLASRHLGQSESALRFLFQRDRRLGSRAPGPTVTLVESLQVLRRTEEALEVLRGALQRRPRDGELGLFAADFHGRASKFTEADRLLSQAQGRCGAGAWRRTAATVAGYQSQKAPALEHWRELLKLEPLAHDAIQATALLLAETEGPKAALSFLDEMCGRFPYSTPLLQLRIQWVKQNDVEAAVGCVRRLLEFNPANAWGWRELAVQLTAVGQAAEALSAAEEAIRLEPYSAYAYSVRAHVQAQRGLKQEAREDFRRAVRLEVDDAFALVQFVQTATTLAERREALAEVAAQLRAQVIFRDALAAYRDVARGALPAAEVLALLREAHASRPDLWQGWSVLIHQLIDTGNLSEALTLAREATERFPLLAPLWMDLARVERAQLNHPGEVVALEKALSLSPRYALAARELAGLRERMNELTEARTILETAVASNPLDARNHGCLAQVLWKLNQREAALARIQQALRLDPDYDWAWNALGDWGVASGQPGLRLQVARELTNSRGGEPRSWLLLADNLLAQAVGHGTPGAQTLATQETFAAIDRALELNPRSELAYDLKARLFAHLNQFNEAAEVCSSCPIQPIPVRLRFRAAWVEAERGNVTGAIAKAKSALEQNPEYFGGWRLLADWCSQTNAAEGATQAAEKMVSLAPLDPVPLGYLGDLKLRLRDRKAGQAAFERAFKLNPDYQYAGWRLFQLQLENHELEAAETTLQLLERREASARGCACAVQLHAARGQWPQAVASFERLCRLATAEKSSIASAAAALDAGRRKQVVDRVSERCLVQGESGGGLAEFWVERELNRKRWSLHTTLDRLGTSSEPGRRAILTYLDGMGRAYENARRRGDVTARWGLRIHLSRLLAKHHAWLAADVVAWGKVGYVLSCIGRPGEVIQWLGGWKSHPNVESWMLYNLTIMLQRKARFAEAREVIAHAVTLRHQQGLYEAFRVWAAFEDALAGHVAAAEDHLAALVAADLSEQNERLVKLTRIALWLTNQSRSGPRPAVREVRAKVREVFGESRPYQASRPVRQAYWRLLDAVADQLGWIGVKDWGWGYYHGLTWVSCCALVVATPLIIAFPPLWIVALAFIIRRIRRD